MPDQGLRIRGLCKCYGAFTAVDAVDLHVQRGEFVTLLGPSGSGKTTILMSIAGFVHPDGGEILLDGHAITALPPERRNFGMVFQGYALFPHLTVRDNVAFPLRVRGWSRQEIAPAVEDVLGLVQLSTLADRLPRQLSGGQQQRVALARALVFKPDLLLLDEPLSALDKKLRGELQVELKALHEKLGLTFIYVTHDQEEALSMSDRIAILNAGRLIQLGPPTELYEKPATRFVGEFLGRNNFLEGRIECRTSEGFLYRVGNMEFLQLDSNPPALGEEVLIAIRPEKIRIVHAPSGLGRNEVSGRIASCSYHGTTFHICVETVGLGTIEVHMPAWGASFVPQVGLGVRVGWEPSASTRVLS